MSQQEEEAGLDQAFRYLAESCMDDGLDQPRLADLLIHAARKLRESRAEIEQLRNELWQNRVDRR